MTEESTTPDLVELVRGIWAAVDRRDWDTVLSLFAPDAVLARGLITFEGRDALRGVLEDTVASYDDLESEVEQVRDLGSGVVFAVVGQRGRLIGSGASVEGRSAWVYQWVDGTVVRITIYIDIDEARAAAERLAEERGSGMPQDHLDANVRFVLATYEWGNRERKFARNSWHDDGEWINSREDPDHAVHRGTRAIEKLFASWIEAYPDVRVDPVESRASDNRVFVWVRFSGQGAASGISLDMELAHVVTLEDGRIRRLEEYSDRTEALEAAGLSE